MNKQTVRTRAAHTLANITYYGGTIGAGITLYDLMNKPSTLGFIVVLAFAFVVEGVLRTLTDAFLDTVVPQDSDQIPAPAAGVVSLAKEATR
ncbi:hypothetical protein OOK48_35455 [Streptomyces viridodiastaticus]|uniref:hypothetical protein n=1 Tax=Streptomyces albogriseolus TaxID=1887 RepID=UPI002250E7AE|nr:hypothetical protein [Streptomyces viridodiastaticus]MCX4571619.1 hypothetical protein [Streptomyces viridodiastaticus]